jgi:hypothetical protein
LHVYDTTRKEVPVRTIVVLGILTLGLAIPVAAHHETAVDYDVTPQELHARLTAPPGSVRPEASVDRFHPVTPQELHAQLTDPATHPAAMDEDE